MNPTKLLLATAFSLGLAATTTWAYGSGISGYTLKTSTTGCGTCHASATKNASVTIKTPAFMTASTAAQCTVIVTGSNTGVDIASSDGQLAPVFRLKTLNGELTHPSAGTGTYVFTFTAPATAGTVTLYAAGVSGGFSGSWNNAPNATIAVSPLSSVEEQTAPVAFALEQNFPNPFNPTTTIAYSIPASVPVVLTVYDLNGRNVATLVNSTQSAGSYRVLFNAEGLASGVYIARLKAGSQSAIRKLSLLK